MKIYSKLLTLSLLFFVHLTYAQKNTITKLDSLLHEFSLIDSINNKVEWGMHFLEISNTYYDNGDIDAARNHYKQLISFTDRYQLTTLNNQIKIYYARVHYFDSEYDKAIEDLTLILPTLSSEELELKALALNFLGKCLIYTGNYSEAYEKQISALKIYQKLDNENAIAGLYYGIGNNYFYQGQLELSLQNFQKAYDIYQKLNDKRGLSQVYGAFGSIYSEMDELELSLKYNILYYESAKEIDDIEVMGWALLNVGSIYELLEQFEKGKNSLKEGLELAKTLNDISLEGYLLETLSDIAIKQKEYDNALSYLKPSFKIAQNSNDRSNILEMYKAFANIYSAKADYDNYEYYIENYIALKDSLFNEESVDRIAQISEGFKLEQIQQKNEISLLKKNKQIQRVIAISGLIILMLLSFLAYSRISNQREKNEILIKSNNQILNQNKILENANKDLEDYAKIISHDLREPLRNISGFTTLLKRKISHSNLSEDKETSEFMDFIVEGANQMSNLLSSLLYYSKVTIKDVVIESINIENEIQSIINDQKSVFKEDINLDINLDFHSLNFDKSQFQEMIYQITDNAFKFKQKDRKLNLSIVGRDFDTYSELIITDNGIGIEKNYFEEIFIIFKRLHARANFKGSGVGLAISKKIIEMRGGEINVSSKVDEGSSIHLSIPKKLPFVLQNSIK